eukprot:TRINITY_DN6427_c0_g1_i1.p1 TRINITY_DN6427_c0_g1~~TRINITY_DN6427_c0_g1_i1.p1  ORF type:complete len:357 (-),score=62.13 TRINITY_DN6427_c0_g1_i1:65-1135(-)
MICSKYTTSLVKRGQHTSRKRRKISKEPLPNGDGCESGESCDMEVAEAEEAEEDEAKLQGSYAAALVHHLTKECPPPHDRRYDAHLYPLTNSDTTASKECIAIVIALVSSHGREFERPCCQAVLSPIQDAIDTAEEISKRCHFFPVLLTKGPKPIVSSLSYWLHRQFDCHVSPHTFTPNALATMAGMWALPRHITSTGTSSTTIPPQHHTPPQQPKQQPMDEEEESTTAKTTHTTTAHTTTHTSELKIGAVRPLELRYTVPPYVVGLSQITLTIPPSSMRLLYMQSKNKTEQQRDDVGVIEALEKHFFHHFRISLSSLILNRIGTEQAYISADGRIKIFSTAPEEVLAHLATYSQI